MTTKQLGDQAESAALKYLQAQGLDLLSKNYACRRGEIDLIMQDENCIVFVEVRMRNNTDYGSGADTVTTTKMRKLALTAEHFLQQNQIPGNLDCRFDVISLDDNIDWIQHAFTLDSF
jgi:putative endonuclease